MKIQSQLKRLDGSSFAVFAASLIALYVGRKVFMPIALASVFAVVLTPLVRRFEKWRFPRPLAIVLVLALLVTAGCGFLWAMGGEVIDVITELPRYRSNIERKISSIRSSANSALGTALDQIQQIAEEVGRQPVQKPVQSGTSSSRRKITRAESPVAVQIVSGEQNFQNLARFSMKALEPLGLFIVTLAATAFMLLRRESLENRLLKLGGVDQLRVTAQALSDTSNRLSRFLFLQLLVNVGFGTCIGLSLAIMGLPHTLLWGAIAAIFRFIPYVGTFTAGALPVVLAFAFFHQWWPPLAVFAIFLCLDLIIANWIEPLLYGGYTGMSELAVLFAAVFWTVLWGPVGLLVAIPLTLCIVALSRYLPVLAPIRILLSDEPALTIETQIYDSLLKRDFEKARSELLKFAEANTLVETFDQGLMPTLALSERDRNKGLLDRRDFDFLISSLRELAMEAPCEECDVETQAGIAPSANVLCLPAQSRADHVAALMMSRVLETRGISSQTRSVAQVRRAETLEIHEATVICVTALPPFAFTHSAKLIQTLRSKFPEHPIVVMIWGFSKDLHIAKKRFDGYPPDAISPRLAILLEEVRAMLGAMERVSSGQTSTH